MNSNILGHVSTGSGASPSLDQAGKTRSGNRILLIRAVVAHRQSMPLFQWLGCSCWFEFQGGCRRLVFGIHEEGNRSVLASAPIPIAVLADTPGSRATPLRRKQRSNLLVIGSLARISYWSFLNDAEGFLFAQRFA